MDDDLYTLGELFARARLARRVGINVYGDQWPSYAWPGGYTLGYLTDDMDWLCGECMNNPTNPIHFAGDKDGWHIVAADIIEESEYGEYCSHCNKLLCEGYLCPECQEGELVLSAGPLAVCPKCDWTEWGRGS